MNHEQESREARATAYVFGELSPEEVASFEKELDASVELRDEVAGVEEAVAAVQAELGGESQGVSDADRTRIETAMASRPTSPLASALEPNGSGRKWLIGLAVAASVIVVVGLTWPKATNFAETAVQVSKSINPDDGFVDIAASTEDLGTQSLDEFAAGDVSAKEVTTSPFAEPVPGLEYSYAIEAQTNGRDRSGALADEVKLFSADRISRMASESISGAAKQPVGKVSEATPLPGSPRAGEKKKADYGLDDVAIGVRNDGLSSGLGNSGPAMESRGLQELSGPQPSSAPVPDFSAPQPGADVRYKQLNDAKSRKLKELAKVEAKTEREVTRFQSRVTADAKQQNDFFMAEVEQLDVTLLRQTNPRDFGRDEGASGDRFAPIVDNAFLKVGAAPLSTFSIDVDTASYSKVRMYLMQHKTLPDPNAVRIEELLNYFTYDYAPPKPQAEHPFATTVAVSQCPWNPKHRLARVAIKGKVIEKERPASNLVFLLDVSGSMNQPNKLPLVVEGMKMLTKQLGENDMVALVVYAGAAGLVLDSTCGDNREIILDSLDRLRAGGSTAGAQGIQLAYNVARDNFIPGGTNRVILCTDGDFNVGVTSTDALVKLAEENAKGNIFLSVLGFGSGNHNDAMMEQISNKGNGNYAFLDSKKEAEKVLVEQMGGTLVTIAKDVKIQVEFNPKEVASYRLIGYENRVLAAEDFNDDTKDAGEIGAGHTVTALYELVPQDEDAEIVVPTIDVSGPEIDDLRYRKKSKLSKRANSGELLMVKLRYKQPEGSESTLIEVPVKDDGQAFSKMDQDFKFAGTVAAFGMMLRNSPHKGNATFAAVEEMAGDGIGADQHGRRTEFIEMVKQAKELSGEK